MHKKRSNSWGYEFDLFTWGSIVFDDLLPTNGWFKKTLSNFNLENQKNKINRGKRLRVFPDINTSNSE